jgi:hypothetical protein
VCVDTCMGKDWAKGLTAKTDPRVARMATARRGRKRGPYRLRARPPLTWTPEIAYAVGLVATDGNLSPSGRHVSVSSAEREVLETFLRCVERSAHIGTNRSGFGSLTLRVQIGDVGLYRWLQSIGLTPRKSHTIGAIDCPKKVFPHLLRGLLDGDGSIVDGTYDGTGKARGRRYRVLKVRFISASETHVNWLRRRIAAEFGLSGSVRCEERVFRLTYSKRAAVQLLHRMYPEPDVPCLERKHLIWRRFQRECPKDAARGKMTVPAQVV